ncbi:MAG: hypothetical protein EB023_08510, partial [Flavobacteriia bacterium]|nr:hypothetical protein [Flavobacteriia bacterium]
ALLNQDTVTICSNGNVNLNLVANTAVTFNWYADPNVNVQGETTALTISSQINDQLVNPTGAVQMVQYHVIGTSVVNGCSSPIIPIWVFVNPTPVVTPNPDLNLCHNQWQAQVVYSGNAQGTVYAWNAVGANVGLPSNGGVDSLYAFVASNPGFAPITSTVVVFRVSACQPESVRRREFCPSADFRTYRRDDILLGEFQCGCRFRFHRYGEHSAVCGQQPHHLTDKLDRHGDAIICQRERTMPWANHFIYHYGGSRAKRGYNHPRHLSGRKCSTCIDSRYAKYLYMVCYP